MKNTLSGGRSRTLGKTFDFLLLTDVQCAAVVDFRTVAKAVVSSEDVIQIGTRCLPTSRLAFVVRPSEVTISEVAVPPIVDAIEKQCRRYVERVRSRCRG